ncbi:hypothetical protein QMK19_15765 [Streptomyces sp. H10-C2]|uniref:hypothetical protein n=1 Tax=unclassified Streptomyces TaxID=2593676 RepID=UPI0024B98EB4|nr:MULTISPECIES: hypothetical protein [unclassified Streptomyces]MDJ0343162.1 hypothetical protein [Streptomyces sp. PH10-H1]MDJ0371104.1 hypothetical protein [Streptomyces sp. H10-C2]
MRSAQDPSGGGTGTPIYDALYSEYRRLFRALPGDRSGEEAMQFNVFATWHEEQRPYDTAPGRHRGNRPAALPPGRPDNRMYGL